MAVAGNAQPAEPIYREVDGQDTSAAGVQATLEEAAEGGSEDGKSVAERAGVFFTRQILDPDELAKEDASRVFEGVSLELELLGEDGAVVDERTAALLKDQAEGILNNRKTAIAAWSNTRGPIAGPCHLRDERELPAASRHPAHGRRRRQVGRAAGYRHAQRKGDHRRTGGRMKRGFTLLEVMIATIILSVGLVVLLTSFMNCQKVMMASQDFETAQYVLSLGETAYPLPSPDLVSDDPLDNELLNIEEVRATQLLQDLDIRDMPRDREQELDKYSFRREVDKVDDEELERVRTTVSWGGKRGMNQNETTVLTLWRKKK